MIFNFTDVNYIPENGGFHPVEIRLIKQRGFGILITSLTLATKVLDTLNW
ncbi:DUF2787 family protein [Pseudoalteromonas sp. 0303]|nr:DUF2787 family protein [Pseudoalteromonas sp. 0303]